MTAPSMARSVSSDGGFDTDSPFSDLNSSGASLAGVDATAKELF